MDSKHRTACSVAIAPFREDFAVAIAQADRFPTSAGDEDGNG